MEKNCIIWTRVSTKEQEKNGGSLEAQRLCCTEYAYLMVTISLRTDILVENTNQLKHREYL